jgi:hypothetical protein
MSLPPMPMSSIGNCRADDIRGKNSNDAAHHQLDALKSFLFQIEGTKIVSIVTSIVARTLQRTN